MLGRVRMSGETTGLLVACQNACVVSEMKGSLWTARKRLALWASSSLWSLILYVACPRGWDTGLTTHERSRRECGAVIPSFSVHRLCFKVDARELTREMAAPSSLFLHLSQLFIGRACQRPSPLCGPMGGQRCLRGVLPCMSYSDNLFPLLG